MRLILFHNPTAGDESRSKRRLVEILEDAGHEVVYQSTAKSWKKALKAPVDLVVAAGGDGTVRKVALELVSSGLAASVPLAVLPVGTANNVGKSIRAGGDMRDLVRSWATATPEPFDLGIATVAGEEEPFIESIGGGILAALIRDSDDTEMSAALAGRETDRALHHLTALTREAPAAPCDVWLDGRDHSGEYLMVEVLNTRLVGPNLPLAPDANPGDGQLDVVLISSEERQSLLDYFRSRLEDASAGPLKLPVHRAREISLVPPPSVVLHVDDKVLAAKSAARRPRPVDIRVDVGALRVFYGHEPTG